ncbi:hypothetical protein [Rhodopseudomonas sp. B29]|uniref:hypothetical protein n=1 Tax=Rhodopseudomonas sp. B29 TaxID=95607 RepID=UPI0011D1D849|nr:hypothetical protein [Rhodopseudomonas sp. B29]
MRSMAVALGLYLAATGAASAQPGVSSVYSQIDNVRAGRHGLCRTIHSLHGGEVVTERCPPGPAGWSVNMFSADARTYVSFGRKAAAGDGPYDALGGAFADPHHVIEWRLIDGRPFAAIHRYYLDGRQALVVHRLQPDGSSCVAGVVAVRRGHDANREAADLADAIAPSFRCGRDRLATIGDVRG